MSKNRHASQFMSLLILKRKTPEQVAEALEVTPRAVYYWLSGAREPKFTIRQIQALCQLLECSVHELPADFGPEEIEGGA